MAVEGDHTLQGAVAADDRPLKMAKSRSVPAEVDPVGCDPSHRSDAAIGAMALLVSLSIGAHADQDADISMPEVVFDTLCSAVESCWRHIPSAMHV